MKAKRQTYCWKPSKSLVSRFMAGNEKAIKRFITLVNWIEENTKNQCAPQKTRNIDHMMDVQEKIEGKEFSGLLPAQRQEVLEDFFYAVRSSEDLDRCENCKRLYGHSEMESIEDDPEEYLYCPDCFKEAQDKWDSDIEDDKYLDYLWSHR